MPAENEEISAPTPALEGLRKGGNNDVALVSARVLEKLRQDPNIVFPSSDSVVISTGELSRIKAASKIISATEREERKMTRNQRKIKIQEKAAQRRTMMKKFDETRKAKKITSSTEIEERDSVLAQAQRMLDEEHDEVKKMNSMVLYAKCVAIRDKQIEEKEFLEAQRKEEERKLDNMMEIQRLNSMRKQKEKKAQAHAARVKGAEMIKIQMAELEQKREKEKHDRWLEGQAMIKQIKRLDELESQQKHRKILEGVKLLEEIKAANTAAMQAKDHRREKERQEEERIAKYIVDKECREAAYEKQMEEQKACKDKEIAKIRAQQEKAADQQAEVEMLRAKRSKEEADRKARDTARARALKQQRMARELEEARLQSMNEKERLLAIEARDEREEFEHVVKNFKEQEAQMLSEKKRKNLLKSQYNQDLLMQIKDKEDNSKSNADEIMRKVKKQWKQEAAKLQRIKDEKIRELSKAQVPDKYLVQLKNYKPAN